jgi:predicted ArsR family transcriptional regulator
VLALLDREGDQTARALAAALGITERSVRRILTDLETDGYIERQRVGRRNIYRINFDLSLRRSDQYGATVGELLKVLRLPGSAKR